MAIACRCLSSLSLFSPCCHCRHYRGRSLFSPRRLIMLPPPLQIYCPSPSPSLFSPRRHYSASLAHRSHSTPLVRLILLPLRPPDLPARRGPSPSLPPPSRFAHSLSPPPAVGPPCQNHCRRPREASASRASREERRKGEGEGESGRGDVWLFIILLCGSRRGSDRFNTLEQNTSIVDYAYVA